MMWGVTLILVSCVAVQVASHEIEVECHQFFDSPPIKNTSPSFLVDLKVNLVTVGKSYKLNISWAINIDASIEYLECTRIVITGDSTYRCEYHPPLATANLTGSKQKWFHYLASTSYGYTIIQVANLPLPPLGSGLAYKSVSIKVPKWVTPPTTQVPIVKTTTLGKTLESSKAVKNVDVPGKVNFISRVVAIFGGLASLMILSSCYIIYKRHGANFATFLGFKMLPTSPMVPVPVLMVYPAENSAFQWAVVALAEFLQWHGGCSVAVDMWQQGKIAELGPIRWLAEQSKAADRVLIVCPQAETPSSQLSSSPKLSIPAAAHDLYPLILNMVGSHAKSASDLAKFWVVQLGEQQAKSPNKLALELSACKIFCLMKDLAKLCRSLHTKRQDGKKIADLIFRPGVEKNTVKLREAVEKLGGPLEPFKSVLTTI